MHAHTDRQTDRQREREPGDEGYSTDERHQNAPLQTNTKINKQSKNKNKKRGRKLNCEPRL